jgi:hypothetical protein
MDFHGEVADFRQSNDELKYHLANEIFVCSIEATSKVIHFERVATGADMLDIGADNTQPEWRTSHLDLLVYSESIADEMLDSIVNDITLLVDNSGPGTTVVKLSGATI